jgi:nucleoside-diphosphate-sugar epimerase
MLAARSNIVGKVFNIGGGSRISVNELIKQMEEMVDRKADIEYIEEQKGDVRDTWADVSKAREILHWVPKVNINSGLKRFIEWYKKIY